MFGAVLDAIADRIAARIGSRIERERFDSRNLPPRTSRRRFSEVCRTGRVADARREGRDWTCSREAWEAARGRKPTPPIAKPTAPTPLDEQADRLLARSGLRIAGGSRR
jgi:hypothetical protein